MDTIDREGKDRGEGSVYVHILCKIIVILIFIATLRVKMREVIVMVKM